MDLKLSGYDLDVTDGELAFVTAEEAIAQDIVMELRTWLAESSYDIAAGLPYLQIIFAPGTTTLSVRSIVEVKLLSLAGVEQVLELDTARNAITRELTISGTVRVNGQAIAFNTGVISA